MGSLCGYDFRFNRRDSRLRGLLFQRLLAQAVQDDPRTYNSFVVNPAPRAVPAAPPRMRRIRPETLDLDRASYPWRS